MKVTFRVNSNVLGYSPGQIIEADLYPLLKAVLLRGVHLTLIDPPSLEDGYGASPSTAAAGGDQQTTKRPRKSVAAGPNQENGERTEGSSEASSSTGQLLPGILGPSEHRNWHLAGQSEDRGDDTEGEEDS